MIARESANTESSVFEFVRQAQSTLPVDVVGLCNDLGIRVFEVKNWPHDESGMNKRVDKDYVIYVNSRHSRVRKRFTVAHEFAHWLLHRDYIGDGVVDDALYRSGLPIAMEFEANRCAADILMPRDKVIEHWQDTDCDLACMAKKFDVSRAAMAIRLGVPSDL